MDPVIKEMSEVGWNINSDHWERTERLNKIKLFPNIGTILGNRQSTFDLLCDERKGRAT
jgi:hypothetical protein